MVLAGALAVSLAVAVSATVVVASTGSREGKADRDAVNAFASAHPPASVDNALERAAATRELPERLVQRLASPTLGGQLQVEGGTPRQQALVRAIAAGLPVGDLVSVGIAGPPGGFREAPELQEYGETWLTITAAEPAGDPHAGIRALWAVELLAGAFRDASFLEGMPAILGRTILYRRQDGSTERRGDGVIAVPRAQPFDPASSSVMEARVAARLAALEDVVSFRLSFPTPMNVAVVADLTLSSPEEFLDKHGNALFDATVGDASSLEGALVKLYDSGGKLVRASAYAPRTGMGFGWSEPGLRMPVTGRIPTTPPLHE